jgi:hypothetical protein
LSRSIAVIKPSRSTSSRVTGRPKAASTSC